MTGATPTSAGQSSARPDFPIVGIGASAGGLEALKEFFAAMPVDSGMAFVIVQHLEPSHESRMAEILAKSTMMKVVQAEDGMAVEPNVVFTNPPGKALSIRDGTLVLSSAARGHISAAIDHFLASLAKDQGHKGICIILSGSSGSDGPRGVRAIRAAGGMCMVQEPGSAQFPAMPQAAIDTGLVDYVRRPAEMPATLVEFEKHPQVRAAGREEPAGKMASDDLDAVLKLLHVRTKSDYRPYKQSAILRRIQRRMGLRQVEAMGDYLGLLKKDPVELTQLARDMLIGVSSFFRDAPVFEELRAQVVAPLVEARSDDEPVRVWVPGCATGEEAYSIAMLLMEARSAAGKSFVIQVFASDVDEQALETARNGVYPLSIAEDLPATRLEAFFTKQGQKYQVEKHLREAVVFSRHNLLTDPPFSRVDLVSCRNVMIYLDPAAQKKVLTLFGFALNVGGYLLLGRSENITGMDGLFEPVDKQNRLYRLTRSNRRAAGEFPPYAGGRKAGGVEREQYQGAATVLTQANMGVLLRHFDASLVLVDPQGKILYFHGRMEKYLGHPEGPANLNIFDMTGGILSARLRRAINKALGQGEPVRLLRVLLPQGGALPANLTVLRVPDHIAEGRLLAVLFEHAGRRRAPAAAEVMAVEDGPLVAQLEAEVKALRSELRSNSEGYETASEELKAANEEVMSMNEELQSANEELEASKEELQSLNEELTTVNNQLTDKLGELTEVNNDLANLLTVTQIATVFLDVLLRIKRFTPSATALLNLIETDVGRSVGHITPNFTGVDLAADAGEVLRSLLPQEKEVQARNGGWYTVRILPYRTLDNRIQGVVITFSDVSRLKQAENRLRYKKLYAESIVETVRHPLLILDGKLRVLSANDSFFKTFRVEPDQTTGRPLYELGDRQWDIPRLRELLEDVILKHSAFQDFRVEHVFPQLGRKVMLLSGRRIEPVADMPERILLAVEDITEGERDRVAIETLNRDLERRVEERTALLTHRTEQLRSLASELASGEQRERDRLARVLHDDLQQLLAGAKYQLANVRSHVEDAASLEACDQMDQLLDQSLDVSRSLTSDLSPPILFEAGLDAALLWLVCRMDSKHGLKVHLDVGTRMVNDDRGVAILLFQAVRELLLNVVKHARVNSADVILSRIDEEHVRIVVSDEGAGFEPAGFLSGRGSATGLGLFGLRGRMERIGGSCEVDSSPGRGTRVTLVARVDRPEIPPTEAALSENDSPAGAPREAYRHGGKIRVLLADDHAMVRQGLARILNQEADIEVVAEAVDGREAVTLAREFRPDVVVMDARMPVVSGLEATREITSTLPDVRVIGLSMSDETAAADTMLKAGAVAYLSKGGPSEELVAAVRSAAARCGG